MILPLIIVAILPTILFIVLFMLGIRYILRKQMWLGLTLIAGGICYVVVTSYVLGYNVLTEFASVFYLFFSQP
jgi:hypothetical protein